MADTTTADNPQETAAAAASENPAMEGSPTYTQEEFESEVKKRVTGAVRERIDRANAKHQKELDGLTARNSELQEQVDSLNSELDGYRKKEQASAWAREVSEETGVPASALRGATKEEMQAHAETLKALIGNQSAPYVGSDGFAAGGKADADAKMREFAHNLFGGRQ